MNPINLPPVLLQDDLPEDVAILPVSNSLLLPRGLLPIVLSDADDISVAEAALKDNGWIGVVQKRPKTEAPNIWYENSGLNNVETPVFEIGCLGQIISSHYADEGFFAVIKGICRFKLHSRFIRNDQICYKITAKPYIEDMQEPGPTGFNRDYLYHIISKVLPMNEDSTQILNELFTASDERLVTTLAMAGPFSIGEKQALLEADTLPQQFELMTKMMEMTPHDYSFTQH